MGMYGDKGRNTGQMVVLFRAMMEKAVYFKMSEEHSS